MSLLFQCHSYKPNTGLLWLSRTGDPLVHHGWHFGRSMYAMCNVQALITNALVHMAELKGEVQEETLTFKFVPIHSCFYFCSCTTLEYKAREEHQVFQNLLQMVPCLTEHWQACSRCTRQAWLKMVLHSPQAYQSPTSILTTVASIHIYSEDSCTWLSFHIGAPHMASTHQSETHAGGSAASIHIHSEDSCIQLRFHLGALHTASTCHSETHADSLFESYFTSLWHSPSSTMRIHSWLAFLTPPCRYIANLRVISPRFVS